MSNLENLKKNILKNKTPSEYESLGNLIMNSPIKLLDYNKIEHIIQDIVKENEKFINNKKYAIFSGLGKVVVGKRVFVMPRIEKIIIKLKQKYPDEIIAVLISQILDQLVINYLKEN